MRHAALLLPVVCTALLVACGPPGPQADPEAAEAPARDAEETVFDDMIQTQDRARAVEDIQMQHKRDLDAAIDRAADAPEADH